MPKSQKQVTLTFNSFDIEKEFDKLTIYDGPNINGRAIGTYSGQELPPRITSTKGALSLQFSSDNRTTAKGWLASWETAIGSSEPGTPPISGPEPPAPVTGGPFQADLEFNERNPVTQAILQPSYEGSFTLSFDDKDKSGRGLVERFYNVAQYTKLGWRSNIKKGFLYHDFDQGLGPDWIPVNGNWDVREGVLAQTDINQDNSNIFTSVAQEAGDSYLYHWRARMSGNKDNRRLGLHFFISDPTKTNRGDSYFVWIRDARGGDFVEIYKTVNDRFSMKMKKSARIEADKVYDYKVIYHPDNGRIEVYIDNAFLTSWTDPFPIKRGGAVSFRSGACVAEFEALRVMKARGSKVQISVGNNQDSDILTDGADAITGFRISSLVMGDASGRRAKWSPSSASDSRIQKGGATPGNGTETPIPGGGGINRNFLQSSYSGSFVLPTTPGLTYYLVSENNKGVWGANERLGFLDELFDHAEFKKDWLVEAGDWDIQNSRLIQRSEDLTNTILSIPVTQKKGETYL